MHKPKIRKTQLEARKRLFHFGTSFAVDPIAAGDYEAPKMQQRNNISLRRMKLFELITNILEQLWSYRPATDYDFRPVPPTKLIDALGMLTTQNNMEIVIIEVSSGAIKENTTHSIEDSLKIFECSVASLRKEASHYPHASLKSLKLLNVFSLHVIKTQVTLCEMVLSNNNKWKFIERRTACIPTNRNDLIGFVQYLELLTTLFVCIINIQSIFAIKLKFTIGWCSKDASYSEVIG